MARYYQKDKGTVVNLDTGKTAPPEFQITSTSKQVYNPATGYMETPSTTTTTTRKGRPSPRTGTTGAGIQKFGTQQLKYLDPEKPALGVKEMDVGARFRLFTNQSTYGSTPSTPFSQKYQQERPATIRTVAQLETSDRAIPEGIGTFELPDFGEVKLPTLEDIFGANDKHGCECQACKDGTGQCSDKVPQCDAWDLVCEGTGGATVGVVGGTNYFFWIKIILVVIGIGVLLWLLRPLFGIAKNITEK